MLHREKIEPKLILSSLLALVLFVGVVGQRDTTASPLDEVDRIEGQIGVFPNILGHRDVIKHFKKKYKGFKLAGIYHDTSGLLVELKKGKKLCVPVMFLSHPEVLPSYQFLQAAGEGTLTRDQRIFINAPIEGTCL